MDGLPAILVLIAGVLILTVLVALLLGATTVARREAAEAEDLAVATAATVTAVVRRVEAAEGRLQQVEQEIRIILESGTSPELIPATRMTAANPAKGRKEKSDDQGKA